MRSIFLLAGLLGLLAAGPVQAQSDSLPATPLSRVVPISTQTAQPDTVAAIHRLFERGRARRRRVVFGILGVGGTLTALGLFSKPATNDPLDVGLTRLLGGVAGVATALVVAAEMIGFDQYSRLNEQRALDALGRHALPRRVRYQLTAEHFAAKF